MKICERGLDFIQVTDAYGLVRICGWMSNSYIGNLLEDDLDTIYHSALADEVRRPLIEQTYENCLIDNCPYLSNGKIEDHLVEIDEIPHLPSSLYLAYEGKCNYNCTCCTSHMNMEMTRREGKNYEKNYEIIENKLKKIMPYVKTIGAHGRGELFASPRILDLLSKWKPVFPDKEVEVRLETNGSLFDREHWKQIENLGMYRLRVAITIMSFNESVYQFLSGVKYPIDKLIDNLYFVKSLREKNIINELELATVLQEQNFREMPEFVRKCIEEFGADSVRVRPIIPGGRLGQYEQWFMNVRNPEHPYYYEYKKIMEDEIFQHPKVLLWSGNLDSERIKLSSLVKYNEEQLRDDLRIERKVTDILYAIATTERFSQKFKEYMNQNGFKRGGIWGIGKIGKAFMNSINLQSVNIERLFDKELSGVKYKGLIVEEMGLQKIQEIDVIIITSIKYQNEMKKQIIKFEGKVVTLEQVIKEIQSL